MAGNAWFWENSWSNEPSLPTGTAPLSLRIITSIPTSWGSVTEGTSNCLACRRLSTMAARSPESERCSGFVRDDDVDVDDAVEEEDEDDALETVEEAVEADDTTEVDDEAREGREWDDNAAAADDDDADDDADDSVTRFSSTSSPTLSLSISLSWSPTSTAPTFVVSSSPFSFPSILASVAQSFPRVLSP